MAIFVEIISLAKKQFQIFRQMSVLSGNGNSVITNRSRFNDGCMNVLLYVLVSVFEEYEL